MRNPKTSLFTYDSESDILAWEVGAGMIAYGTELGNVIVHFNKNHAPVLVEVLEATKLLTNALGILEKSGIAVPKPMPSLHNFTREDFSR